MVCLSTFDNTESLTSAFEAAGDKKSKTKFIGFLRTIVLGFTEMNQSFQAFLDAQPSIRLTFLEISEHVATLVQVDGHGDFCRVFLAALETLNSQSELVPVADVPQPVAALRVVPSGINQRHRESVDSVLTDNTQGGPAAGYFNLPPPGPPTSSTFGNTGVASVATNTSLDNVSKEGHTGASV